jgi:hypothetical protein
MQSGCEGINKLEADDLQRCPCMQIAMIAYVYELTALARSPILIFNNQSSVDGVVGIWHCSILSIHFMNSRCLELQCMIEIQRT